MIDVSVGIRVSEDHILFILNPADVVRDIVPLVRIQRDRQHLADSGRSREDAIG
jgi:hypothetical protein